VSNGVAVIYPDTCIACGICTRNCPVGSLAIVPV
jgi:NAD-dependent dihydropyrimidine dehydrogenase PreA subunit